MWHFLPSTKVSFSHHVTWCNAQLLLFPILCLFNRLIIYSWTHLVPLWLAWNLSKLNYSELVLWLWIHWLRGTFCYPGNCAILSAPATWSAIACSFLSLCSKGEKKERNTLTQALTHIFKQTHPNQYLVCLIEPPCFQQANQFHNFHLFSTRSYAKFRLI